jgi:hypothetical protein
MIPDDVGRQLHDKATRGVALSDEEQARLAAWYPRHPAEEAALLAVAPPPLTEEEQEVLVSLPPATRQAFEAFRLDLPRLLRDHPRMWVAYTAAGQFGEPNRSKTVLWQSCVKQGLQPDQFIVKAIEPLAAHLILNAEL